MVKINIALWFIALWFVVHCIVPRATLLCALSYMYCALWSITSCIVVHYTMLCGALHCVLWYISLYFVLRCSVRCNTLHCDLCYIALCIVVHCILRCCTLHCTMWWLNCTVLCCTLCVAGGQHTIPQSTMQCSSMQSKIFETDTLYCAVSGCWDCIKHQAYMGPIMSVVCWVYSGCVLSALWWWCSTCTPLWWWNWWAVWSRLIWLTSRLHDEMSWWLVRWYISRGWGGGRSVESGRTCGGYHPSTWSHTKTPSQPHQTWCQGIWQSSCYWECSIMLDAIANFMR